MIYVKRKSWIKRIVNVVFQKKDISVFASFSFLKIFLKAFLILLIVIYSCYLFILPQFLNEKNAELFLTKFLEKNTKLIPDVDNLKVKPNYKFDINIKADVFKLKYSNSSDFVVVRNLNTDINIFSLIFGYIDFNKINSDEVYVYTDFEKSKKYSCFEYFNFNSKISKLKLGKINFYTDSFVFNLFDKNINQKFIISANKAKFSSYPSIDFKNRQIEILTSGVVKSEKFKISDFDLRLIFKTKSDSISRLNEIISKINYNPFIYANEYQFYSRANINLKITPVDKRTNIDGIVNLSDFSFVLNNLRLPKNNLVISFKGDKVFADCDFNFIKNQFIKVKSKANLSKNKYIELYLNSSSVNLAELKDVINALNKIFNVDFKGDELVLSGSASADLFLKSNFKTISSSGKFEIKNASILDKKTKICVKNINSNINLQNNKVDIVNTSAFLNNSKFYLAGFIDEKMKMNLKINSDTIDIVDVISLIKTIPLISSFVPNIDDYIFKSGLYKITADIKGDFNNPVINAVSKLDNFRIFVKSLNSELFVKEILISANPDKNSIKNILIDASDLNVRAQGNFLSIKKAKLKILKDSILIDKSSAFFNDFPVWISGEIKNYSQNSPTTIIKADAVLPAKNKYIVLKTNSKTAPRLSAEFSISKDKIFINNFIVSCDSKKLLTLLGSISNYGSKYPVFNNVKLDIENKVSVYLPQNLIGFEALGNLSVNGSLNAPKIDGNINLYNVISREINLYVNDLVLNIKNSSAYINIVHGKIFGFDFDLVAQLKLLKDKILVDFAQLNSTYFNLDTLNKYTQKNKDLNIEISDLKANFLTFEAMDMLLNSLYVEGSFKDNVLCAKTFKADVFNGNISGSFVYNLKSQKTSVDVILKEISVRMLSNGIKEIKNLSIAASGKLSALIKADFSGFDFNTLLKTFDGYIKFNIDDGELSQFAKLERFLQAGNILSQSILKLTLNSTLSTISKQNTGDFKTIEGTLKIKNSNADVQYIKTQGSNMSLYITGTFNLLTQMCNIKVFGRIPESTVSVLGPIGKFSTSQIVEKMSDDAKEVIKSITVSPIEKMLSDEIPSEYISKIPPLAYDSTLKTREFVVRILGNANETRSIRYFKWNKKGEN